MAVKNTLHTQTGFSLIEVMISLAILGMVLTGVVAMFSGTGRHHTSQEMMMDVTQNVRAAKHLMVDEIRSAACDPQPGVDPASTNGLLMADPSKRIGFATDCDAQRIHFTRDIDNGDNDAFYEPDGDAEDPNEDIAYYRTNDTCIAGGTVGAVLNAGDNTPGCLRRDTGGGGQPVASNIIDLQFIYYDINNAQIALPTTNTDTLDSIRSVEVIISGQVENTNRVSVANQTWTQQFRVRVRNL